MKQSKWNQKKNKIIQRGFWVLGRGCGWVKSQGSGLFKNKETKGKREKGRSGKSFLPDLWSAVWTAKRCLFRLKI